MSCSSNTTSFQLLKSHSLKTSSISGRVGICIVLYLLGSSGMVPGASLRWTCRSTSTCPSPGIRQRPSAFFPGKNPRRIRWSATATCNHREYFGEAALYIYVYLLLVINLLIKQNCFREEEDMSCSGRGRDPREIPRLRKAQAVWLLSKACRRRKPRSTSRSPRRRKTFSRAVSQQPLSNFSSILQP